MVGSLESVKMAGPAMESVKVWVTEAEEPGTAPGVAD
jgi:hypothetical protein